MNWLAPLVILALAWSIASDVRSGRSRFNGVYTADRASAPNRFWGIIAGQAAVLLAIACLWIDLLISK
jgi:hypothetical protein